MFGMQLLFDFFTFGIYLFLTVSLIVFIVSLVNFLRTPKSDENNRQASRSTFLTSGIVLVCSVVMLGILIFVSRMPIMFM